MPNYCSDCEKKLKPSERYMYMVVSKNICFGCNPRDCPACGSSSAPTGGGDAWACTNKQCGNSFELHKGYCDIIRSPYGYRHDCPFVDKIVFRIARGEHATSGGMCEDYHAIPETEPGPDGIRIGGNYRLISEGKPVPKFLDGAYCRVTKRLKTRVDVMILSDADGKIHRDHKMFKWRIFRVYPRQLR